MFKNETEMQKWLTQELESSHYYGLNQLIANINSLEKFKPKSDIESKIQKSFKNCLQALDINEIFSNNQNIAYNPNNTLKPDFLLYSPETQGMVIIEIKNHANASRQAGTELGAYCAELKTHLPFLSDGDVFNVIISPEWRPLLKQYAVHEMIWKQRNILCLRPIEYKKEIKLEIVPIHELLQEPNQHKIAKQHLMGYQICMYDYGRSSTGLDENIEQMKTALSVMAAEGNRCGSHGFAFLWGDGRAIAPYAITTMNIAPFQFIERIIHQIDDMDKLSEIQCAWLKLMRKHDPSGHGQTFNHLSEKAEEFLKTFCTPCPEGFFDWASHEKIMFEQGRAELVAFRGWGIFETVFHEKLLAEYKNGNTEIPSTCPYLGLEVVNSLIDEQYEWIDFLNIDYESEEEIELMELENGENPFL